jgi:transposase
MGDAGEGLIDADARIQERMEELERERAVSKAAPRRNPEQLQALESLRLARLDVERQLAATPDERRRAMFAQALGEIDRRMAELNSGLA